MNPLKCCKNCSRGTTNNFNKDMICTIKGIVSRDFACSKFKAVTLQKNIDMSRCIECEFFIIDPTSSEASTNLGYCQLFTVRQFNGDTKKACSKFSVKKEFIIS